MLPCLFVFEASVPLDNTLTLGAGRSLPEEGGSGGCVRRRQVQVDDAWGGVGAGEAFPWALEHHATLAPTSEMRTSKLCSKGCGWKNITEPAKNAKEEKKRATLGVLAPMRGERRGVSGRAGESLYSVRFCPECRTVWHRDVNAARNIVRMFLHLRFHDGQKPLWACRRRFHRDDDAMQTDEAEPTEPRDGATLEPVFIREH